MCEQDTNMCGNANVSNVHGYVYKTIQHSLSACYNSSQSSYVYITYYAQALNASYIVLT